MKYKIDTHMHTTASDGTLEPKEILEEIREKNIKIFSITDHDSIENIDKMKKLVKFEDEIFIPGVEVTTTFLDVEFHFLAYGDSINKNNRILMDILNENKNLRKKYDKEFIKFVSKLYDFTMEEYMNYKRNPKNGGWKAQNFLYSKGIASSLQDIFELRKKSKIKYIMKKPSIIIPKLKNAGLTVVLAHPPAYFESNKLSKKILDYFKTLGLDGIECMSPYYNVPNESKYYTDYCENNNLLVTSGSDYHGKFLPKRKLGNPNRYINDNQLNNILNKCMSKVKFEAV
ncbi:MAG: PHP domain-containing protein [Bacillota bacterium]